MAPVLARSTVPREGVRCRDQATLATLPSVSVRGFHPRASVSQLCWLELRVALACEVRASPVPRTGVKAGSGGMDTPTTGVTPHTCYSIPLTSCCSIRLVEWSTLYQYSVTLPITARHTELFGRALDRRTCTMEAQASTSNFEAIRALHLADKSLGADKLIAKLKQQRPDLKVSASEVRATLRSLRRQAKEEAAAAEARTIALREALLGAGPSSGAWQSSSSGSSQP